VTQSDHITIAWNGHCACAVSRDLSPKTHVTVFDPELSINYIIFIYGATMTIKGSSYLNIPVLKRVLAPKKNKSSQNLSPKWRFSRKKGLNIRFSHRDPQKAHPWPERRLLADFS